MARPTCCRSSVAHNDRIPLTQGNLTRFHSRAAPGISISDYLRRIVKYAAVERICLMILLIYIDRVCERKPDFTISSLTVHRFIITGITCACKTLCDTYLSNTMYARVGGLTTKELNVLELEFLFLIDWNLNADVERLQKYYVNLVRQHPDFVLVAPPIPPPPVTFAMPAAVPAHQHAAGHAHPHAGFHYAGAHPARGAPYGGAAATVMAHAAAAAGPEGRHHYGGAAAAVAVPAYPRSGSSGGFAAMACSPSSSDTPGLMTPSPVGAGAGSVSE
ncbi:Pho80p cyclin [Polyrhizophydium stewartii]|uniref:Pho80p cyclin n=1 Tax=Polyrhizophydium stewartii TaxID=2732419 RepID=A0ABR4NEJ7_9FUNG